MSMVLASKAWFRRIRTAAPSAWKQDQIFRWAVIAGGLALLELLTQATQHPAPPLPIAGTSSPVQAYHARAPVGSTSF